MIPAAITDLSFFIDFALGTLVFLCPAASLKTPLMKVVVLTLCPCPFVVFIYYKRRHGRRKVFGP